MSDNAQPKRFQCRHIHADGRRCGSPALRHEELCYYHHTSRKPAPHPRARRGRQSTFDLHLPDGNDRTGLQLAIVDVLRRIAGNEVDPRRAGLLLYGLQIAATNLPQARTVAVPAAQPAETVDEIVVDENLGTLAPRYELIPDDPGARNRSLTEQLLAELRRGRDEEEAAAVCPSCKAQQHNTGPAPDSPATDVDSVTDATPEILASLDAAAQLPSTQRSGRVERYSLRRRQNLPSVAPLQRTKIIPQHMPERLKLLRRHLRPLLQHNPRHAFTALWRRQRSGVRVITRNVREHLTEPQLLHIPANRFRHLRNARRDNLLEKRIRSSDLEQHPDHRKVGVVVLIPKNRMELHFAAPPFHRMLR